MAKKEEVNNGFGELPKPRKGLGKIIASVVVIAIYVVAVVSYRSNVMSPSLFMLEDFGVICAVISSVMLGEVMRSFVIYGEERNHITTRYSHSWLKAFQSCLPFSTNAFGIIKVIKTFNVKLS